MLLSDRKLHFWFFLRGLDMMGGTEEFTTLGTKRVRKTVRGVSTEYTVVRDRFARTGKWERFRDPILGSSRPVTDIIGDGLKNAVANAKNAVANFLGAVKSRWTEGLTTDDGRRFWAYTVQDFVLMPAEEALRGYEEDRSDTTTVSTSLYSLRGALRKGGTNLTALNKLGILMPAGTLAFDSYSKSQRGEGWLLDADEIVSLFTTRSQQDRLDAQAADARGSTPFIDSNALGTYVDLHDRQHNYLALEWRSVAANTTTSILSPFARDRAAGVNTLLQSNRMVAGEVSRFDSASVVAFAEGSVGGVGGDPSKTPGAFV
jgi:hypothetical protein